MTDLQLAEIELSNGETLKIVHGIGDMIQAAFDNWIIRVQTRDDETWFKEISAECFAEYIRSKGDVAMSHEHYLREYANEEE